MSQSSRQVQTQNQQQIQTLSPQQLLVVRLLELPAIELEDRVRAEVLENPALEEGNVEQNQQDEFENTGDNEPTTLTAEELDLGDYRTEDDIPDYKLQANNHSRDERAEDIPFSESISFYEILKGQLAELDLDERKLQLAEYLVGSLDDDGLLRKSLTAIEDELAIYAGVYVDKKELTEVLHTIQELDPPGIGGRDLQECLLLQIRRKEDSPLRQIEEKIINDCYDEFTHKHWTKIMQRLGLSEEKSRSALAELVKLNPRPGSSLGEFVGKNFQQIVPDFIVETGDDGVITVNLNNRGVPELRMSRSFVDMLDEHTRNKENQSRESKNAMLFLKQKMDAAQNFIDAVKQRQNTLMTTMQAIVDLQRPFFLEGDEGLLRPMILKDVADCTGLDISTISRVGNSKYVQTDFGVFPLKFFFSDGYTTESGEELSVREIKQTLKELVDSEDKNKPLTDDEMAALLKEKGYPIARRTVAKYREQLNIPVARLRKL